MRLLSTCFLFFAVIITGCVKSPDHGSLLKSLESEVESGNLTAAINLSDSLKKVFSNDRGAFLKADSLGETAHRIKVDFTLTSEELLSSIQKKMGSVSPEQIASWENQGWFDFRVIDGRKMYFNRSASNLVLLRAFHEQSFEINAAEDDESAARKSHTTEVLGSSDGKGNLTGSKKMGIEYTITVDADAVPENEIVRCWLPWPKGGHPRQGKIHLLGVSQEKYSISPDSAVHSTMYMEKKAEKGVPTVFSIAYEYESGAQWFDPDSIIAKPYDKNQEFYKEYTSEQLPHINFSPEIRMLTDSICGSEKSPVQNVISIWRWFKVNIPWTGAIEYSILPDITAYACTNRRGDCGIQTMMFMSMLRYKGIPVRWQSGWKVPPYGKNLHDWCEVYFEGTGWIPVDVSYDLQNSDNQDIREFFMSGIDAYRLIVNDGIAGRLWPEKEYLRSEPYDFQRGEVEWKGGNLYFDKWDYEMKIEYKN